MAKQIGNGTASEEPPSSGPHGASDPASGEPSSSSSHVRTAPDVALLYRLNSPRPIPAGALPAPHLDLVSPREIEAASRFLTVLFPRTGAGYGSGAQLYAAQFFLDRGEIRVALDPTRRPHLKIPSLVANGPFINSWLHEWADPSQRGPRLDPPWAVAMGLDEQAVYAIADGITHHLSQPDATTIAIRDTSMREIVLRIPPRAQLRARAGSARRPAREAEVSHVERTATAVTPGGEKVLLYMDGTASPTTQSFKLDPTTFRRTSVSVPQRIKVLDPCHSPGGHHHE